MSTAADANLGTGPVREGYALDTPALEGWLRAHVEGYGGPLEIQQFKGGQSNPTYKLVTPGQSYVHRKQPPGTLLKGAHAVDREAKVLIGMEKASFPVAHVYGFCSDPSMIETMFYVMPMVEGRIFWDATLPNMVVSERRAIYDAMNATIAALHSVDYAAVGLSDYGRSGNYFARRSSAGPGSIWTMSRPGATPTWIACSNGCRPTSRRVTRRLSSTATFASTT